MKLEMHKMSEMALSVAKASHCRMLRLWTVPFPSLLFLFSWLSTFRDATTPASSSRDLVSLAKCLDTFTILPDYYDPASYLFAQPTQDEREAWVTVVTSLLSVDGDCLSLAVPPELEGTYEIQRFGPPDSPESYCVLAESSVDCNAMPRGWGSLIVPEKRSQVSRFLHLSAPHPKYDRGTIEQATALFQSSGAKSLLLAGRTRMAFMEPSTCVVPASAPYMKTDPAHDNLEPFFDAFAAIYQWQQRQGGCRPEMCAFVQMHGKGVNTCALDQVFLSSGLGNSPWYTDSNDYPVKRLKANLKQVFPTWNISLPSDSKCVLTAAGNIGGRYINGVPKSQVCSRPAIPSDVNGEFIHIEQAIQSRQSEEYEAWSEALRKTFEPSCAPSMAIDPRKLVCVDGSIAEEASARPWRHYFLGFD